MKVSERKAGEGVVEYAERLSDLYASAHASPQRKSKGQFFTPIPIGRFMSKMFEIEGNSFRLLDPGAGTGNLIAAFCQRLLDRSENVKLVADAYENDPTLSRFLAKVLEACKQELEAEGHLFDYNIYDQDFILANEGRFRQSGALWGPERDISYDFAIANPPYYKLSKNSPQSTVMSELICGQPNIYALFMAVAASVVKPGGQMVFITPRSFCSGLYYKKFREWLLNHVQILQIHTFESRKEIFDKDGVLQENIILKAKKSRRPKHAEITMTVTRNKDLSKPRRLSAQYTDIVARRNGEKFIRIPASSLDLDVLHMVDSWPMTLKDVGLQISTGPVVPFRATEYLLPKLSGNQKSVPLLWMHNVRRMAVVWPAHKTRKPSAIRVSDASRRLLLPVKNYVLLKRFSSKEQRRRLEAAVMLESDFSHDLVGIENHLNYIHRPKGNLTVDEAFGIAALLNTPLIDNFFRSLNGNTQVNAVDIRSLPLPTVEDIGKIGKLVREGQSLENEQTNESALAKVVAEVLGIRADVIRDLTGEYEDD